MKRSEVLAIIRDVMKWGNGKKYLYEDVLQAIEEAGMLPPSVTKRVTEEEYNGGYKDIGVEIGAEYDAFEWEEED